MSSNFNVSLAALNTQNSSQTAQQQRSAAAAQAAQQQAAQAADTVKLSVAAQVKELNQEGLSASNIAATLGLTTKEVDSYLNVLPSSVVEAAAQLAAVSQSGGQA
jgi:hypothetical protein